MAPPAWRQRAGGSGVARLVLWACLLVGLGASAARADVPVGLGAGYAFRLADPAVDDRLHGVAAGVGVAGPPLLAGFSGRGDALVFAWPAGDVVQRPLLFVGGAASATYLFDDTATRAVASIGAFGGAVVDGDTVGAAYGPIAGLSILVPVVDGVFVEARVAVPWDLGGALQPTGTATVGLAIAPDLLLERAMRGEGPAAIAVDAGVPGLVAPDDGGEPAAPVP
jgi:hypothetical protein